MTDAGEPALSGVACPRSHPSPIGALLYPDAGRHGAEVIKLEGPQGDMSRTIPPYYVGDDSVYYLSMNRNKRSIVVDMKSEAGVALVRDLALACDVIIENFRPGVCERLGLSVDALRAQKPSLIWCSISGFGQDGPYRDKPASTSSCRRCRAA